LPAVVAAATGAEATVSSTVHPSSQALYNEVYWRRRRHHHHHHHRHYGEAEPVLDPAKPALPSQA
jgi:hypothetical protein